MITRLVDGIMEAGRHLTKWDGREQFGGQVASGLYVYQIVAGEYVTTRKLILLK